MRVSDLPLYLHLIGAAIWLGGLVWLGLGTVVAGRALPREQFRVLARRNGWAFARLSAAAWVLLISTGLGFAFQRGWPGLAVLKVVLSALVLLTAALHIAVARRGATTLSRVLSALPLLGTLGLFWIGVRLAG